MNFKPPRDPNTPDGIVVLRYVTDGSERCQVGSGECQEPAVEAHDGGGCGEFLVCARHLPEVRAFSKLVNEMTPAQVKDLEAAIKKAADEP